MWRDVGYIGERKGEEKGRCEDGRTLMRKVLSPVFVAINCILWLVLAASTPVIESLYVAISALLC